MTAFALPSPAPQEPDRNRLKLWLPKSTEEPAPPRILSRASGGLSPQMRLSEFMRAWFFPIILQGGDEPASQETLRLYEQAMARWVEFTGDPPVCEIDEFLIEQFRAGLRTATYSRGLTGTKRSLTKTTQKKHLAHLRHILYRLGPAWDPRRKTAAVLDRAIHIQVATPPTVRKEPFMLEQARSMIACADKMPRPENPVAYWRLFVALHFYTGLRAGTIQRLRQEHITHKGRQPWLDIPGELVSKTGKPIKIPMHRRLIEALEPFASSPTLLPQTHCYRYLFQLHADLQSAAGIPADQQISPHGWRRTHACELANLGANNALSIAQKALDHADKRTTENHYCDIVNRLILKLPDLWSVDDPMQQRLF